MMNEMMRNGSGYIDTTAYQGMTRANPGEIWTKLDNDDYMLVIAVNGIVCSVLNLTHKERPHAIAIEGMYTCPHMVSYLFSDKLGRFVKSMPQAEFEDVRKAVASALGIVAMYADVDPIRDCLVPKEEVKELKAQLEEYRAKRGELEREAEKLRFDLEAAKIANSTMGAAMTALEEELTAAKPYRQMYDALLDRLIAKVGGAV